jgi:hypothetical protein
MANEYVGDCSFDRDSTFTLDADKFGVHTLSRTYLGREDELLAFIKKWPEGKSDTILKQFKLVHIRATGQGPFTQVVLDFAGLLSGELPDPREYGGWSRQTTTLKILGGETTTELIYRAPTATFEYVTNKKPETLRYPGVILTDKVDWQVRGQKGDRTIKFHEVPLINSIREHQIFGRTKVGFYNYARVVNTEDFAFEKIAEGLYRVREVNIGEIVEPARNDLPRFLSPRETSLVPRV